MRTPVCEGVLIFMNTGATFGRRHRFVSPVGRGPILAMVFLNSWTRSQQAPCSGNRPKIFEYLGGGWSSMRGKTFVLSLVLLVGILNVPFAATAADNDLQPGEIMVGFASVDVTPPIGVPLAGFGGTKRRTLPFDLFDRDPYAHYFEPSTGIRDPIRAKAMALEINGQRLIFVRLDLILVSTPMRQELLRRVADLGIGEGNLVLTATHTHSGPGALFKNTLWEIGGTDVFVQKIFDDFMSGVEKSVRNALSDLAPSRLFTWSTGVADVQRKRRYILSGVDRRAAVLLALGRDGTWRGGLLNFALHPVWFSARNNQFSGDATAAIETMLEDKLGNGAHVLFLNGASADVSVIRHHNLKWVGNKVANAVLAARHKAQQVRPNFWVGRSTISLPPPRLTLSACVKRKSWRELIGEGIGISLASWFSNKAPLTVIKIGDITMLNWPGEVTTSLGNRAKAIASAAGARDPWLVSMANDYFHYFTTEEEAAAGRFEGCASMHGAGGGKRILKAFRKMLGRKKVGTEKTKF